jgi:hypothetical protein
MGGITNAAIPAPVRTPITKTVAPITMRTAPNVSNSAHRKPTEPAPSLPSQSPRPRSPLRGQQLSTVIFTTSSPPVNAVQKSPLSGHLEAHGRGMLRFPRLVAYLQRMAFDHGSVRGLENCEERHRVVDWAESSRHTADNFEPPGPPSLPIPGGRTRRSQTVEISHAQFFGPLFGHCRAGGIAFHQRSGLG